LGEGEGQNAICGNNGALVLTTKSKPGMSGWMRSAVVALELRRRDADKISILFLFLFIFSSGCEGTKHSRDLFALLTCCCRAGGLFAFDVGF